jgi:hypothetical protein
LFFYYLFYFLNGLRLSNVILLLFSSDEPPPLIFMSKFDQRREDRAPRAQEASNRPSLSSIHTGNIMLQKPSPNHGSSGLRKESDESRHKKPRLSGHRDEQEQRRVMEPRVSSKIDPNINKRDEDGDSVLHVAARKGGFLVI